MSAGEIILYTTGDGVSKLEVRLMDETVWLSLTQMAELFQRDKSIISRHIRNIFEEGELPSGSVVANFATTAADGKTYQVDYFNLDVVISVGYRVKSQRGTQFRMWATQRLREYIVKGFALDDERFKRLGGGKYFDELLERIRDIRSSEKVFWRKVLDIYATSVDYDPSAEASQQFFAIVQNKMHWAAHGHTAAEVVFGRADATQPNLGMTNWTGTKPSKTEAAIAKNYLAAGELDTLNRIVNSAQCTNVVSPSKGEGRRPFHVQKPRLAIGNWCLAPENRPRSPARRKKRSTFLVSRSMLKKSVSTILPSAPCRRRINLPATGNRQLPVAGQLSSGGAGWGL